MKPRSVERRWSWALPPYERKELEGIVAAQRGGASGDSALGDRFLSDYGDSSAWWLMLLIAGGGALGACITVGGPGVLWSPVWFPRYVLEYGLEGAAHAVLFGAGAWAAIAVLAWTLWTWATNHRRRGYAVTGFATIRVKGYRLRMLRHADVVAVEWTQHATRRQSFSVLTLTAADGRRLTCYVHGAWVRGALAQIDQTRAAAGLPPIEGDARKLPDERR